MENISNLNQNKAGKNYKWTNGNKKLLTSHDISKKVEKSSIKSYVLDITLCGLEIWIISKTGK